METLLSKVSQYLRDRSDHGQADCEKFLMRDEMTTFSCKFGELEAILADLNDIPSADRTKFQARLKNFHRLGFPKGIGAGRGKAVVYGVGDLVQMGLAVEMTQLGLTPERAKAVIEADEYPMLMAVQMAASGLVGANPDIFHPDVEEAIKQPLSMFLYFDPAALSPWSDDACEDLASHTFFYGGEGIVRENIVRWTTGFTRRLALINVTAMLWHMSDFIEDAERDNFFRQIAEWANWLIARADFDLDQWLCGPVRRAMTDHAANAGRILGPDSEPWGWVPLPDLIEMAGLGDGVGPQYEIADGPGRLFELIPEDGSKTRPDMTIYLPGQRALFVDDKTIPLADEPATAIRMRVEELMKRPYLGQFTDRTKYMILYLRGDRFFKDATVEDKRIWEWAFEQKVIIATPDNMVTILKAAQSAWEAAAAWETAKPEDQAHTLTEGIIKWPR